MRKIIYGTWFNTLKDSVSNYLKIEWVIYGVCTLNDLCTSEDGFKKKASLQPNPIMLGINYFKIQEWRNILNVSK
jgi:hypothetical protein